MRRNAWRYPEASERELSRSIRKAVRDLVVHLRSQTRAMKFDATDAEISAAEEEASRFVQTLISVLIGSLPAIGLAVYRFNSRQWARVAKASGGGKNPAVLLLIAGDANQGEEWFQRLYGEWYTMSAQSIAKLFSNIVADWSSKVRQANFTGKKSKQVNEIAEQRFKVYSHWADNRAVGMVGSWNSRLMRQRLQDAKVTHYFWRGILDERERPEHVSWEGKRISINSTHPFPGEPYGCRCWAEPDFNKKGE